MAITKPPVLPAWAESGDKVTPSNAEIQVGWPLSSIPPSRQRFNWLLNFLANGIRYFSRRGLPDYDAAETYMTGDRIIGDDGKTYRSLIDNNTAQTPSTSPTKWEEWAPTLSRFAALIQGQTYTAFTTAGAAPNFTLTPSPAITAYAAGQRFRVKFHAAGTGTDVLNVSALGNKSLKQYDSTGAKVAAVIAASQLADVEYDGEDMVIVDALPASTGITPPQFDNDTSLATTAFVQRALGNFSGESAHNVDTQLTGNDFGRLVIFAGSSVANRTFTLPLAAAGASGCKITFWNNSSYNLTVVPFAGDFLDTGTSAPASIVLGPGSTLVCETFSSVGWRLIEGTARLQNSREFASSVAANGYQRLPNGIIIQWMQFAKTTTASPISNSWPIAFPTALWNISGTIGGATNPNGGAISASGNTTTCTIYTTSGQPSGTIMVIGIGN